MDSDLFYCHVFRFIVAVLASIGGHHPLAELARHACQARTPGTGLQPCQEAMFRRLLSRAILAPLMGVLGGGGRGQLPLWR